MELKRTFMKRRTETRRIERRQGNELLAGCLMLAASLSLSCGHNGQGALNPSPSAGSSPTGSPVVQLSPDTPGTAAPVASPARKVFKTGEAVPAGYLGYKVYGSWFSDHLTGQDSAKHSSADNYLYVDLSVVNTDKKERSVGLLKLMDEKGKEYSLSEKASTAEQSVGQIGKLGPSMSKRAFAIFEVPRGHEYRLKLQGFSAGDEVTIELAPKPSGP